MNKIKTHRLIPIRNTSATLSTSLEYPLEYLNTTLKYLNTTLKYLNTTLEYLNTTLKYLNTTLKYLNMTLEYLNMTLKYLNMTSRYLLLIPFLCEAALNLLISYFLAYLALLAVRFLFLAP
ncbi:MAG: hypothetical protein V7L20_00200 [Nostoc sp.]|uniref:hypothetical protein n=1 Tax=Nostoc sp. TaxID=1180 RepID=UPI002FF828B2